MNNLKVVFMGTPNFSVPALKMLIEKTNVVLVVCQPDKIVGRKKELSMPITKQIALENNIEVFQPIRVRNDYQKIVDLNPDIIITAAYGQIIPKELIDAPKFGCINIHGSLLPKYRGAAPIQWSIINGDNKTGITLMYMDEKMDTGNIIAMDDLIIDKNDNYHTLYDKLSVLGKELLEDNLNSIVEGTNESIKQNDDDATYARMLTRDDELINFEEDGRDIYNKIRGVYPNAYTILNGEIIKLIKVKFEENNNSQINKVKIIDKNNLGIGVKGGIIYLEIIKPFGKKEMDIKSFINGIDKEKYKDMELGN